MKKTSNKMTLIYLAMIVFFMACATTDPNVESLFLDDIIQKAGENINSSLNEGTNIAVLNFSSNSEALSEYIVDELTAYLTNSRHLTILDRRNLNQIRNEMDLQLSGEVSDDSAQSIGKFLGAQSIVTGSVQKIGNLYRLRFNTINVETAVREAASSYYLAGNDRQANALINTSNSQISQNSPRELKRSYFVNNGGAGIFIALPSLQSRDFDQGDIWILNYVRGSIENFFRQYSNIIILDRSEDGMQTIRDEQNYQLSGLVADEHMVSIGRMRGAELIIVGTITKINNSDFSMHFRILNVETGVQSAISTLICTLEEIRDTSATRRISYELLTQMGVIYTDAGRVAILQNN